MGVAGILGAIGRYWRLGVASLLLVIIAAQALQLRGARGHLDQERQAHAETIVKLAAAAEVARRIDAENALRVEHAQTAITQEVSHGYQAKLDDLRSRAAAQRLREGAKAGYGGGSGAAVPGLAVASGRASQAPGDNGLSGACPASGLAIEQALIASEQALQLDALIAWTERQAAVPVTEGARP